MGTQVLRMMCGVTVLLTITVMAGSTPVATGEVQGQVKIVVSKGVELAESSSPPGKKPYSDLPVVVLSKDGKTEISQTPVDLEGRFRIKLPPGDYLLDLKRSGRNRLLVTARPFTITAGQTVQVDLEIESAVRPM